MKKSSPPFPRAKIARIVREILPKGREFELRVSDSAIRNLKVVRIVTPAWKNLRPPERISKVLRAVNPRLTPAEQEGILRFSVLTPAEYDEIMSEYRATARAGTRPSSRTKSPPKRETARKPKAVRTK